MLAGVNINPGQLVASRADGSAGVAGAGQIVAGTAISAAIAANNELVEIDMTKVGPGTA